MEQANKIIFLLTFIVTFIVAPIQIVVENNGAIAITTEPKLQFFGGYTIVRDGFSYLSFSIPEYFGNEIHFFVNVIFLFLVSFLIAKFVTFLFIKLGN